jgi:hypothetical protein
MKANITTGSSFIEWIVESRRSYFRWIERGAQGSARLCSHSLPSTSYQEVG